MLGAGLNPGGAGALPTTIHSPKWNEAYVVDGHSFQIWYAWCCRTRSKAGDRTIPTMACLEVFDGLGSLHVAIGSSVSAIIDDEVPTSRCSTPLHTTDISLKLCYFHSTSVLTSHTGDIHPAFHSKAYHHVILLQMRPHDWGYLWHWPRYGRETHSRGLQSHRRRP